MRYWLFFATKLAAVGIVSYGLLLGMNRLWPAQEQFIYSYPPRFGHDLGYTLAMGIWFLVSWGLLYAAIWDQRYRCRACLRRLRMPILTGSWSRMLQFGRPEVEYICTYGHGKLLVPELQFSGKQTPAWTPQADMWQELVAASKGDDPRR